MKREPLVFVQQRNVLIVEPDDQRAALYTDNIMRFPVSKTTRVKTPQEAAKELLQCPEGTYNTVCFAGAMHDPISALSMWGALD